ncbi:hypothetical protein [Acinetobacter pseudolwoffii]|uniref:hypothetical protein n=1 Tax=Acinetobacter pseudolwoffii TaxID=2053287 RepID=UPI00209AFE8F|nr:hypothetical protein [Acinetobacter pseudolwoffii]MCO8089954.1 hypothetical protein [Acinetobacter pseudolwoffii]
MEFLVILFMLIAVFYIVIIAPALRARKNADYSGSSYTRPASGYADRPKMSPLLGIEISASQQRRLGRNDPSVIAAKLYRQQKDQFASFQQARTEPHPAHYGQPNQGRLNQLFNDFIRDEPTNSSRRSTQNTQNRSNRPVAPLSPLGTNSKQPTRHPQPPYRS